MDNYETGIYTDNPDDTLRYMRTTPPVDLWGYPKQEQDLVEVVRCKECRYFHENVFGDEIGMGRPYDCLIVGHCCCEFWGRKDDGSMTQTSPEGFCSFGERREQWSNILKAE